MSRDIGSSMENALNAWRQRGWQDGDAGKPAQPPNAKDESVAYLAGWRNGHHGHTLRHR